MPDIGVPRRAATKKALAVTEHEWVVLKSSGPFQRDRCCISALPAGGQTRPLPRRHECRRLRPGLAPEVGGLAAHHHA
eukprot:7378671-Alexandrium_andersonii.AAC.1